MKKAPLTASVAESANTMVTGMKIGRITDIDDSGQIFIDFAENQSGPVVARMTTSVKREILGKGSPIDQEVLLAFENNDLRRPIIVDTMYSLIDEITDHTTVVLENADPQDAVIDGKRIVIEAQEDIVLRCGKASITLTKTGKVLIKGEHLLSRSSGSNKIKGGSIQLN